MGAAAYLVTMGASLPTIGGDRRRTVFAFDDPDGSIEWTAGEYAIEDAGAASVEARRYYNALRTIRRAMDEAFGFRPPRDDTRNRDRRH